MKGGVQCMKVMCIVYEGGCTVYEGGVHSICRWCVQRMKVVYTVCEGGVYSVRWWCMELVCSAYESGVSCV